MYTCHPTCSGILSQEVQWWIAQYFSLFSWIVAYNELKFCPTATWNSNASIFFNNTAVVSNPRAIFVDLKNAVYVTDRAGRRVVVFTEGSTNPTRIIFGGMNDPRSIFVTSNGDLYIDSGMNGRVDRWEFNATSSVTAMYVSGACFGLFVDTNNDLYCSMGTFHRVVKSSLSGSGNTSVTVAGTGSALLLSTTLNSPSGIFVDKSFNLYVADSSNNRIQRFKAGQLNATTVAGATAPGSISLWNPTGVTLDSDGYLFIVDSNNHRVIASSANGFRCLFAFMGVAGSRLDQLSSPLNLAFDNAGNIYVADQSNNRVQKFSLATNSCGKYKNDLAKQPRNRAIDTIYWEDWALN